MALGDIFKLAMGVRDIVDPPHDDNEEQHDVKHRDAPEMGQGPRELSDRTRQQIEDSFPVGEFKRLAEFSASHLGEGRELSIVLTDLEKIQAFFALGVARKQGR